MYDSHSSIILNATHDTTFSEAISPTPSEYYQLFKKEQQKRRNTQNDASDSLLQQAIQSYNEIDKKEEDRAFHDWLKRKKQTKELHKRRDKSQYADTRIQERVSQRSVSPLTQPSSNIDIETLEALIQQNLGLTPSSSIPALKNMTAKQVESLIQKLEKNTKVYNNWLTKKQELERQQQLAAQRRARKEAQIQKKKKEQDAERQKLIDAKVKIWLERKKEKEREFKSQELERQEAERAAESDRIARNKEAFNKWLQEQKQRDSRLARQDKKKIGGLSRSLSSSHAKAGEFRQTWVDPWLTSDHDTRCRKQRSSTPPLLSPPHLYKEYDFYSRTCPEYLVKFRNQVALAGCAQAQEPHERISTPKVRVKSKAAKQNHKKISN